MPSCTAQAFQPLAFIVLGTDCEVFNVEGAARGRKAEGKSKLSAAVIKQDDGSNSSTGQQEARIPPVNKKKRRR